MLQCTDTTMRECLLYSHNCAPLKKKEKKKPRGSSSSIGKGKQTIVINKHASVNSTNPIQNTIHHLDGTQEHTGQAPKDGLDGDDGEPHEAG